MNHSLATCTKCMLIIILALNTTLLTAQNVPSYVPTYGLVGWWPFNGNANDESGNGNNFNVTGAVLTSDRFGHIENAYSFDGIDDFVSVNLDQKTAFTISTWIRITNVDAAGYQGLFQHKGNCERGGGHLLSVQNANLRWIVFNCGECSNASCPTEIIDNNVATLSENIWTLLTITADGTGVSKLYIDGALIKTINNANVIVDYGNQPFSLGKHHDGGDVYYLGGKIDDIGYWDRSLTLSEISGLHESLRITSHPTGSSVAGGHATTLSVAASTTNGAAVTYAWQRYNGSSYVNLTDGADYLGATTSTLTVKSARVSQSGPFRCIVSTTNASVQSNTASLTVTCPCNE
jgi:hypothetical protein